MARSYGVSLFDILRRDVDDFILVYAAYRKNAAPSGSGRKERYTGPAKEERIRVTEKTATGGWF